MDIRAETVINKKNEERCDETKTWKYRVKMFFLIFLTLKKATKS